VGLGWGLPVFGWASTLDWIVRTAVLVAIFRRGGWTKLRV
jgi:Na+-driven multidrug efflux pump